MRISDERLAELAGIPTLDGALWESDGIVIATAAQLVLDLRDARVALRLAVEALEQREAIERAVYAKAGECGIALAKIESLMSTEEPAK